MIDRLIRTGLAVIATTALAGGAAWAQEEPKADDDTDPCADIAPPCGEEDTGGAAGGETASTGEAGGAAGPGEATEAAAGGEVGVRGTAAATTIPAGRLALSASVQVGFSADSAGGEAGNPLSIAPDVWYGINEHLSAGAITSIHGITGFWSGALRGLAGTGVCVSGEPDVAGGTLAGCANTFDNVGAEGLYAVMSGGSFGLAIDAGVHALSIDPGTDLDPYIDVKLGLRGLWRSGAISVGFAPSFLIALTERPDDGANADQLFLPVHLAYRIGSRLDLGVQSGILGRLKEFGDNYAVPVALGGVFALGESVSLAAAFSFDRVTGGTPEGQEAPGAADLRSFSLMLGYML
jgi:hypothetical protein